MSSLTEMKTDDEVPQECVRCAELIGRLRLRISELKEENSDLRVREDAMRHNEDALRHNTALFESLIAHSSAGITLTGADRRILKVVRGLTAFDPTSLVGSLVELCAIPEDQQLIVDCYKRLLSRSCQQVQREIRVPCADQTVHWFSVTMTDMLDNPDVQAIVWNYHDITAQKEARVISRQDGSAFCGPQS